MNDAELFREITKNLADHGLLGRTHVIRAGTVEVHVLTADERRPVRGDSDRLDDETLFASAANN